MQSTSPALLGNGDICGELLLLCVDDHGIRVKFTRDAGFIPVLILRCVDDGLLVEGLREVTKGGVVSGDGGGEKGDEKLHVWDWLV